MGQFPSERTRLLNLLKSSGASGIVLLSGDRHLSEIAELASSDTGSIGYPLYEVTSSSLNQPSGNTTKAGARFANEINPYRVGLTYFDVNYGNIRIDWTAADPVIRLQICDEKGSVVLQQRSTLSALQPSKGEKFVDRIKRSESQIAAKGHTVHESLCVPSPEEKREMNPISSLNNNQSRQFCFGTN